MKRFSIYAIFFISTLVSCSAQNLGLPSGAGSKAVSFRGRIVLYDWFSHEFSANEHFIVKTLDPKFPYIQVMYRPQWEFDAPANTKAKVLDRWAFIAHGTMWEFSVFPMKIDANTTWCRLNTLAYKYKDETGSGEISRFLPTPGASQESIASVESLPCFVIQYDGLKRADK